MREIKFRGQKANTLEWVYGDLVHVDKGVIIVHDRDLVVNDELPDGVDLSYNMNEFAVVYPNTVSQFTNCKDSNGIDIYEGDIVKVFIQGAWFITVVTWGSNKKGWSLKCDRRLVEQFGTIKYYSLTASGSIEVISNIHDNPDLLTKTEEE